MPPSFLWRQGRSTPLPEAGRPFLGTTSTPRGGVRSGETQAPPGKPAPLCFGMATTRVWVSIKINDEKRDYRLCSIDSNFERTQRLQDRMAEKPPTTIEKQFCTSSTPPWKKATEQRRSEEVLAGMLTRTGRDAHTSQDGQQPLSESSCTLALLRAGCPRPVVQHLHRSGEVGLGQAVGLAGGDSDLDSGTTLTGDAGRRWGRGTRGVWASGC